MGVRTTCCLFNIRRDYILLFLRNKGRWLRDTIDVAEMAAELILEVAPGKKIETEIDLALRPRT